MNIERNCERRDTPQCRGCARAGSGEFYPLVAKIWDKNGRLMLCRCLSFRDSDKIPVTQLVDERANIG